MSTILINDTTATTAVAATDKKIVIRSGGFAVLRSSNLDGSAVVALYYEGPDGTVDNPSTDDDGNAVTLTPTNPERLINAPGTYRVAVTTAATTKGAVWVER